MLTLTLHHSDAEKNANWSFDHATSAADLWKNCGFGGKSTKIGTDHAEYTRIDLSYSAKKARFLAEREF